LNLETFREQQQTTEGVRDILLTWRAIQSNHYPDTALYLQWLVFRIMLAYDLDVVSQMSLDSDFGPTACAGPGKPDLCILGDGIGYALEVTERPVLGKIEHYGHIGWMLEHFGLSESIGCLVARVTTTDIPPEVWSAYKAEYSHSGRLFMACGVDFLVDLLRKDPRTGGRDFIHFLAEARRLWVGPSGWKEIKASVAELQREILSSPSPIGK